MDAHATEAEFEPAVDQVEPSIPVLRPLLPTAHRLLPYLARIDETRTYSNWGPLVHELHQRLCSHLGQPPGSMVCARSGTAGLRHGTTVDCAPAVVGRSAKVDRADNTAALKAWSGGEPGVKTLRQGVAVNVRHGITRQQHTGRSGGRPAGAERSPRRRTPTPGPARSWPDRAPRAGRRTS